MVVKCELQWAGAALPLWPCLLQPIQPLLGFLYLLPAVFSGRHPMFLVSLTFWGLRYILGFISRDSCTALWRASCLALLWNTGGSFSDPTTLAFCILVNSGSDGWFQGLLSPEAVSRPHCPMAAIASEYLDAWALGNESQGTNSLGGPSQAGLSETLLKWKVDTSAPLSLQWMQSC